jgi:hypothetical protein
MTEAEFERRQRTEPAAPPAAEAPEQVAPAPAPAPAPVSEPEPPARGATPAASNGRPRGQRARAVKPRRVQRMFALEEDLDKKLWLYAIHVGKDRSEVVNDLLRPLVASMVLYDSRDRRTARAAETASDTDGEAA